MTLIRIGFLGANKVESTGISEEVTASADCDSKYEDDFVVPSLPDREL
ncbi:MAG: hypothetical protein AM324_002105 [Candidatus Thorarchaeota archaeon SMTZ1-83]